MFYSFQCISISQFSYFLSILLYWNCFLSFLLYYSLLVYRNTISLPVYFCILKFTYYF